MPNGFPKCLYHAALPGSTPGLLPGQHLPQLLFLTNLQPQTLSVVLALTLVLSLVPALMLVLGLS